MEAKEALRGAAELLARHPPLCPAAVKGRFRPASLPSRPTTTFDLFSLAPASLAFLARSLRRPTPPAQARTPWPPPLPNRPSSPARPSLRPPPPPLPPPTLLSSPRPLPVRRLLPRLPRRPCSRARPRSLLLLRRRALSPLLPLPRPLPLLTRSVRPSPSFPLSLSCSQRPAGAGRPVLRRMGYLCARDPSSGLDG